ncbi:MAG: class I SAM-dependent methyltransferase [Elusimicrobia bacterium]|nr:class I SAM-dependent methyltransferase [Elusimicrobiota bacterium]
MKRAACNLCASAQGELIRKGVYGNPRQSVYRCLACGHVYLAPLLSDADEETFYINDYPAFLLKRGDAKNASPADHFAKNRGEAARRLELVQGLLRRGQDVLEIGSATGYFLHALKKRVRSVLGVEPNSAHAAYANSRGVPTCQDLQAAAGRRFDLVFLYYVLEHVKEPHGFLKQIRSLLRGRGAKLVLEVPNGDEALVSLYRSQAYDGFVWQRAHCSYFSPKALGALLRRDGFRPRLVPAQRYDLSNHMVWLGEGRPGGLGRYRRVFSDALEREYKECLKRSWACDSIMAVAEVR